MRPDRSASGDDPAVLMLRLWVPASAGMTKGVVRTAPSRRRDADSFIFIVMLNVFQHPASSDSRAWRGGTLKRVQGDDEGGRGDGGDDRARWRKAARPR
jgi:hypothetical protein